MCSSDLNTYEKIQRAGEGYDLASAIARLEAGDASIKAKSMVYTEGTDLENLPKDIMTMHEKAEAAAENTLSILYRRILNYLDSNLWKHQVLKIYLL